MLLGFWNAVFLMLGLYASLKFEGMSEKVEFQAVCLVSSLELNLVTESNWF